jgi:hypothetical protein
MCSIAATFALAISCCLVSCIAPLPVKSIADPAVRGKIVDRGIPQANIQVWVDHENSDACNQPQIKTLTDKDGVFFVEGKTRSWTWVGWANNHYVSTCIIGPNGPRATFIRAGMEPTVVNIDCDLAIEEWGFCAYSCDGLNNKC